jgi:peroxiredoxin
MPKVQLDVKAPDFALQNFEGQMVCLSDFTNWKNVLLVFNRGFT